MRREQFERSLDVMNYEMAGKTAESMARYHTLKVAPLERRLRTIELVLGIALVRWCYWKLDDGWHWVYMKFTEPVPDGEVDGAEEGSAPDTARSMLDPMADPAEEEIKQAMQRKVYPH